MGVEGDEEDGEWGGQGSGKEDGEGDFVEGMSMGDRKG